MIELIVSMAITAIVLAMIVVIINTAANSYKHTNEKVNLQLEAQIAISQLSTIAMEASNITISDQPALGDVKYLIKGPKECYAIYYRADRSRLYLISATTIEAADLTDPVLSEATENQYLMAEYVSRFHIELIDNTANISLEFALGESEYTENKKVKLRNAK